MSIPEPMIAIPLLVARDSAMGLAKIYCKLLFQGGFFTTQYGALQPVLAQLVTAAADSNETPAQFLGGLVSRATYDIELTAENYRGIANDIRQANLKLEAERIAAADLALGVERNRQYRFPKQSSLLWKRRARPILRSTGRPSSISLIGIWTCLFAAMKRLYV